MSSLPTSSGGNIRWARNLSPQASSRPRPAPPRPTYRCLTQSLLYPKEFCVVAPSTGHLTSHLTLTRLCLFPSTLTSLSIATRQVSCLHFSF